MKRSLAALAAVLALAGASPAAAQRPPLYGIWLGAIRCGPNLGRYANLFMYGDGTGLLELGVSPATPDVKPAVAMVSLRQPPEADYVLIDRWISNGVEPRPQLAGRIGPNGRFTGQVLNDPNCSEFVFDAQPVNRARLFTMARDPLLAAQREARRLDPPPMTAKDAIALAVIGYAILGGGGGGIGSGGGGGGGGGWSSPLPESRNTPPPSVAGNVHGNFDKDVHGNEIQDAHGNTLRPLGY